MKSLLKLTVTNLRLYLREPITAFFIIGFPVMLVLIFGAIFGNQPSQLLGGRGSMDISMPGYTALILGTVGLLTVTINTSSYREAGILRRFRATPLSPLVYLTADVLSNQLMTLIGMLCMVIIARLLFHTHFEGNALSVLLGVILGGLSMSSLGYVIASLAPTARMAQVVGMVLFYPMMFISGAAYPSELLPASLKRVAEWLPLTYVTRLLRGLWFGGTWSEYRTEALVLVAILAVATLVATRIFRWE
ncbi:MAG TPA: ABC transporter permease [Anaerolineae bacterium]|nr:ABC transporter permease [Anaerolineae bacterium]